MNNQGFLRAIITDNQDPQGLGRVKLKYPGVWNGFESDWCRLSHAWASSDNGAWLLPKTGDEVVVYLESEDMSCPLVIGHIHNENTPLGSHASGKTQDYMAIQGGSNIIELDDQNLKLQNGADSALILEGDKIAFGSSGNNLFEILEEFCQALVDAQGQFVSTSMGPGSLNPGLGSDLQKIIQSIAQVKTSLG